MQRNVHFKDDNYVCHNGFLCVEVNKEGDILPCCPDWHNSYKFGNIFEQDIESIINSDKAKVFRKSILNKTYQFCNKKSCYSHSIKKVQILKICDENGTINEYPETVRFAHDRTCNLKCITCRDDYENNIQINNELDRHIETVFLPLTKNAKIVHLNTQGEVFASNHCKNLIQRIIEENPNVKFDISSNGVLFNEENCKRLNLYNRINKVVVSLPAASERTYNLITGERYKLESMNFKKVLDNLEYLSQLVMSKNIESLIIYFIVHKYNYKEMIDILKLPVIANHNITVVFNPYLPWSCASMASEYEKMAVWLTNNKEYPKFRRMLWNKIFDVEYCFLHPSFIEIRNQPNFFLKIKNIAFNKKIGDK